MGQGDALPDHWPAEVPMARSTATQSPTAELSPVELYRKERDAKATKQGKGGNASPAPASGVYSITGPDGKVVTVSAEQWARMTSREQSRKEREAFGCQSATFKRIDSDHIACDLDVILPSHTDAKGRLLMDNAKILWNGEPFTVVLNFYPYLSQTGKTVDDLRKSGAIIGEFNTK